MVRVGVHTGLISSWALPSLLYLVPLYLATQDALTQIFKVLSLFVAFAFPYRLRVSLPVPWGSYMEGTGKLRQGCVTSLGYSLAPVSNKKTGLLRGY